MTYAICEKCGERMHVTMLDLPHGIRCNGKLVDFFEYLKTSKEYF